MLDVQKGSGPWPAINRAKMSLPPPAANPAEWRKLAKPYLED
jgi:hypothetical protein